VHFCWHQGSLDPDVGGQCAVSVSCPDTHLGFKKCYVAFSKPRSIFFATWTFWPCSIFFATWNFFATCGHVAFFLLRGLFGHVALFLLRGHFGHVAFFLLRGTPSFYVAFFFATWVVCLCQTNILRSCSRLDLDVFEDLQTSLAKSIGYRNCRFHHPVDGGLCNNTVAQACFTFGS